MAFGDTADYQSALHSRMLPFKPHKGLNAFLPHEIIYVVLMTGLKKTSLRLLALIGLFSIVFTACKPKTPSHEAAKKVTFEETQLDLAGMTPEEKAAADKDLDWQMNHLGEAYKKIGSRNAKWNLSAEDALRVWAQRQAFGLNVKGGNMAGAYSSQALAAGCDDCMIRYIDARVGTNNSGKSAEEIAQVFAGANACLSQSKYHDIYKYYGAIRTMAAYRQFKQRPEQQIWECLNQGAEHLAEALEDRELPLKEANAACEEFVPLLKGYADQEKLYSRVEKVLLKKWDKTAMTYLVRGKFYCDYAWFGRSSAYSQNVKPEQWQLFNDRLAIAEEALRRGMELDPKDGRIPTEMITVASGQGKGLAEMKKWFEAAMEADPNNYDACEKLAYFLLPRWYGSRAAMIDFARHCEQTDAWRGTVPLILANVHDTYNRFDGATNGSYWLQPDVWPDIKEAFEKFFRLNPKAISWRHNYARYAYWCQQWDALSEQLALMGDDINYDYFGGQAEFDAMVKQAEQHRKSK